VSRNKRFVQRANVEKQLEKLRFRPATDQPPALRLARVQKTPHGSGISAPDKLAGQTGQNVPKDRLFRRDRHEP